jgi:hypothetical protein
LIVNVVKIGRIRVRWGLRVKKGEERRGLQEIQMGGKEHVRMEKQKGTNGRKKKQEAGRRDREKEAGRKM